MYELDVRPFAERDRAALVALWQACDLARPWNDPADDIDRAVRAPTSCILIGETEGAVAASIMCGHDGHRGWVYYLAVAPDRRRHGFGARMMQAAETWLAGEGAPKLQLMVRTGNEQAHSFYRALGYDIQATTVWGKWLIDNPLAPKSGR